MSKPRIAVTCGDPAGIGPEILGRYFGGDATGPTFDYATATTTPIVIGDPGLFSRWNGKADWPVLSSPADVSALPESPPHPLYVLDTGVRSQTPAGKDSREGGEHAGRSIELACELANIRSVGAIVTPPISKKSLNLADFDFPGHTEMLAQYLNAPDCQMMMAHEGLRVVPLTRHLPLRTVAEHITEPLIRDCVRVVCDALVRDFGIPTPRIAIAALNPHAGDGGVIGTDEIDLIMPALERLRADGYNVTGPHPADALFQKLHTALERGNPETVADAVIAMYHDQGLVPFKMLAQRRGVNVTVGLPVLRTSVDHGVAYDIAGQGIAGLDSFDAAYGLAQTLTG